MSRQPPPLDSRLRLRPHAMAFWCVMALCAVVPAHGDDIKFANGPWINDVVVATIRDGRVLYTNKSGTEIENRIDQLEGLKLTEFPELAQAQELLEKGQPAEAAELLGRIVRNTRQGWIKAHATSLRVRALDEANRPADAVDLYLQLVQQKAEPLYLGKPPLKSLAGARNEQKMAISQRLRGATQGAPAAAIEPLQQMLELVKYEQAAGVVPGAVSGAAPAATPAPAVRQTVSAAPSSPAPTPPAIPLPTAMPAQDPITQLLQQAQFAQALTEADAALDKPGALLALRLYQRGLAQLYLADAKGDRQGYLDAGLSFMRVAIHFPRSSYAGPSMIEAGYVHARIDRLDVARSLWDKARIQIDSEEDPALAQRLETMMAEVAP